VTKSVETDPIRVLVDSLKIYSPSSEEAGYASFLKGTMSSLGYSSVRSDGAGNVLAEVGQGPSSLLLCGHMDTVPGELPVRRTRTAAFGRGAADAKSPLCALLIAGARSADAGVRVTFAGVTREETDSLGIETVAESGLRFDNAVFGEPSGAGRVTIGYRGRVAMHVALSTPGGHASAPWANTSAFDEFLKVLARLKEFESERTVEGNRFNSVSVCTTLVRAGAHHNVVPPSCEATLDVRLPPGLSSVEAIASLRRAASGPAAGAVVRVAFDEATEAYEAPRRSPLVRAFQRAIITRLKSRPVLIRKTGTGDMNFFASGTATTCVTYGPGASELSHTDSEFVSIRDYLDSIDVLTEAIRQLGRPSST
jgi:LysW-gamma-L-lysine carboxypeptidase